MKKGYFLYFFLILAFCAATFSGCGMTKAIQAKTAYKKRQQALLSEATDWIDTKSKLAIVVTEDVYDEEKDKISESQDIFRVFDFVTNTHSDRIVSLGYNRILVPRSEGIGFAILEYGNKQHTLYEVLDNLSISRKISVKLKDVYSVYALVDDKLYYKTDEGDEAFFGGDIFTVRQDLRTGKTDTLDISVFHCIDKQHNILAQRTSYTERLAGDGKTKITESIHEIGILNAENQWTPITKAGWECPFDTIESACWLNESIILIAMSPSDEPDTSLYIWDTLNNRLSRLMTESSNPVFMYNGEYMARTMYPDPSGEYIAYFINDWSMPSALDSSDSICILSLKTGQVSQIESDKSIVESGEVYRDLQTDMLLWQ